MPQSNIWIDFDSARTVQVVPAGEMIMGGTIPEFLMVTYGKDDAFKSHDLEAIAAARAWIVERQILAPCEDKYLLASLLRDQCRLEWILTKNFCGIGPTAPTGYCLKTREDIDAAMNGGKSNATR